MQQLKEAVENPAQLALPPHPKNNEDNQEEEKGEAKETITPEEISAHILCALFQTAKQCIMLYH
eukprot:2583533-Ditylum_brightwellii.AAC.1